MPDPRRDRLIAEASARLNVPYGLPPGPGELDCSLYILEVCKAAGVPIRAGVRTAEQIRAAVLLAIHPTDVLPGDLLFFERTYDITESSAVGDGRVASHVGMSLGADAHRMLSAVEPVSKESDVSTAYWQQHYLSAGRLPQLEAPIVADLPLGIDVASHQGHIDWQAVAASGVVFGFTKASGGAWYQNPTCAANWHGMKAAGILRGSYHYAFESTGQPFPGPGPEAEADWFLQTMLPLGLDPGDMLALDIEEGPGQLGEWALRWLQHVEAAVGFKPLLYTGSWFSVPHGFGSVPGLAEYGLWIAQYQAAMPPAPAPWSWPAFHQFTDALSLPGVSGPVDGNHFNGAADRIHLYGKPAGAPVPPPSPPPAPDPLAEIRLRLTTIRDQAEAALALLPGG